jgi:plasmid replication initiation protein
MRHVRQLDIFLGELMAPASKDDIGSMEHPMFSIKKGGDRKVRRYEHNGKFIEITPSVKGSATIWDKDILIYVFTLMRQCLDRGETIPERFEINAADLLRAIGRDDSGAAYNRLYDAIDRLKGTQIKTNLPSGEENAEEETEMSFFGLVNDVIVLKNKQSKRLTRLLFEPSGWFRKQVANEYLLTINPSYFSLEGGLERRLYELARKHCGRQSHWRIRLDLLKHKVGSEASLNRFRFDMNALIDRSGKGFLRVVDYLVVLKQDMVHVFPDDERGHLALAEVVAGQTTQDLLGSAVAALG